MMLWNDLKFPSPFCLAVFMEQLTTLGVELRDKDSAARYLASLKSKLANAKTVRQEAQVEVQILAQVVGNLKKMADKLAIQIPALEENVLDGLNELCAKELSLERTTKANEDYKSQNARLTKKLEGKMMSPLPHVSCIFTYKNINITNPDSTSRI
jgi:predicted  nucleic acid-binding Zn-ribbon protein